MSPETASPHDSDENIVPTLGYALTPVVGLGGSSGMIAALRGFFQHVPAESGVVFVVSLPLPVEGEMLLTDQLRGVTNLPLIPAIDGIPIAADRVYLLPPDKHLVSANGTLHLTDLPLERRPHGGLDLLFRSLAETHGAHAVAIVLSGGGGDGAIGLKRVKERGGLAIAQDPAEARYPEKPRAAIDTGLVDWVLKVGEMPDCLLKYLRREASLQLPPQIPPPAADPAWADDPANEAAFDDVLTHLRLRTGTDFLSYNRATVVRRIARRMQFAAVETLPDYLAFLRTHSGEADTLLREMLVPVTNFFRDREAFASLEAGIPALFRNRRPGDVLRVWCVACATGEEAYSLAMLLFEHARTLEAPPHIQIFATDVHEDVLQRARDGVYPITIAADVSEERLRRFFVREPRGYRVRRELRDAIIFAVHDLLRDSPFSRLDLISCRNFLVYLSAETRKRALEIFHAVLRPEGRLFLGMSETADQAAGLYVALDQQHRLYAQRPRRSAGLPVPGGIRTLSHALPEQRRRPAEPSLPSAGNGSRTLRAPWETPSPAPEHAGPWGMLHLSAFEQFGPASILVDAQYDVLHLTAAAGRYLQVSGGEPKKNLFGIARPGLRAGLRAALLRAGQSGQPVEVPRLPFDIDGGREAVNLLITPIRDRKQDCFLIHLARCPLAPARAAALDRAAAGAPFTQELEREVAGLKSELRDAGEQHASAIEEQKADNEELQAFNEELRVATEELETSREELQSVNEELITVNAELRSKLDELGRANSDLQNLMVSTQIATVFLDPDLRILRYTPPAVELFNFIPSDTGRPLTHLKHRLDYPDLEDDARRVLSRLVPVEREVGHAGGGWFLARLLPYRTIDDQIAGMVVTFVDITARKRAEEALRESEARNRITLEAAEMAAWDYDLRTNRIIWNEQHYRLFGLEPDWHTREPVDFLSFVHPDDLADVSERLRVAIEETGLYRAEEFRIIRADNGMVRWMSGFGRATEWADGRVIRMGGVMFDVTEPQRVKHELQRSRRELETALQVAEAAGKAKDHFLAVLSHELRTPLMPIQMALGILAKRRDLSEQVKSAHDMIKRNVELEAHFIDDLLDVTRISHGKMEIARADMDLHEAVRRAVEVSSPDIEAKRQQLTVALDAANSRVNGDFARLQQALWNLLKNASKFTPEGGAIGVRSFHPSAESIAIEITDSGIGMDADVVARIFQPFEQADASITHEFGGLGLGLAIARASVDAHGGELRASSPGRGKGATFTLNLPQAAVA